MPPDRRRTLPSHTFRAAYSLACTGANHCTGLTPSPEPTSRPVVLVSIGAGTTSLQGTQVAPGGVVDSAHGLPQGGQADPASLGEPSPSLRNTARRPWPLLNGQ